MAVIAGRCAFEIDGAESDGGRRCGPVRFRVSWYLYGGATKAIKVCGKHVRQYRERHGYSVDELSIDGKVRKD